MDRRKHIDIAKFWGIALIVLGHNAALLKATDSYLYSLIYAFHVPLFFFLSGCFISTSKGWRKQVVSKLDSLLKPYFVVSIFLIVKSLMEGSLTTGYVAGIFYGNGLTIQWMPMWFLTHLFVASIVSYAVLHHLFSKVKMPLFQTSFSLGVLFFGALYIKAFWLGDSVFFTDKHLPGLPYSFDLLLVTVPYILLGAIYKDSILGFKANHAIGVMSIAFVLLINVISSSSLDLNLRNYGDFLVVNLKVFSSIYMILYLSILIGRIKYLDNIFSYGGKASLFILIFHFYVQAKSYEIISSVFGVGVFAEMVSFLLGLILPIILYWLSTKSSWAQFLMLPIKTNKSMQPTAKASTD